MQLQIRHTGALQDGNPSFVIMFEGKQDTRIVPLTPPQTVKVGTHNTNLLKDLRWYFEKYLEIPIGNYPARAKEIQLELKQWGQECFEALFGTGRAAGWYRDARQKQLSDLCFKVASDDPTVLSWPWEALESRDDGYLAQQCRIERQLDDIGDAYPLSGDLPEKQLNILYIIARPGGDDDVGYQTLARPLVDYVDNEKWPVRIDVLRPPTLNRLRKLLEEKRNFYHIVHFDGHGVFENSVEPTGFLVFESDEQKAERVPATKLGELLRPYNIPVMILNACQSAMINENADDPFASVAMSLLKAGIRSVVAMSYSLWVSGAKVFVPEFYHRLFTGGNVALAMQSARRKMYEENMRDTFTGKIEFNDWVVPVLYQQSAEDILPELNQGDGRVRKLPPEISDLGDYGFIGRDSTILRLEKAIRMNTAGILIHGMAGEGKTVVVKGFLQWMEATHGLESEVFWFSFHDINNAEFIIDSLTEALFGTEEATLSQKEKSERLIKALRDNPYYIVWDSFESAPEITGKESSAMLQDDDRKLLKQFLRSLRGGKTKVIITSRSPEKWLSIQECFRLPLDGLKGEELWQYCNAIIADLGVFPDRETETYKELIDKLDGNPLAVRAILSRLAEGTAEELLSELEDDFCGYEDDDATNRIQEALSAFEYGLSSDFAPVLRLLSLHEHYADAEKINVMLEKTNEAASLEDCFTSLENAGLSRLIKENTYRLHPALRGYLIQRHPAKEEDKRAFVDVMGALADNHSQEQFHEQRSVLQISTANFYRALKLALEFDMQNHALALIQVLAAFDQNMRSFSKAERLIKKLEYVSKEFDNIKFEAIAQFQLGNIALEQHDLDTAEALYKKSLEVDLRLDDDSGAAKVYHQLGIVAQKRYDYDSAQAWYKQAYDVWERQGNEYNTAYTCYQLGALALERRDIGNAEAMYRRSLEIWKKLNKELDVISAYQQLGMLALERGNFDLAEDMYMQSLDISRKLDDEYGMSVTYHQLGIVEQNRCNYAAAEDWYKESLKIDLKLDDEHGVVIAYHQLGTVAQLQNDFHAAEAWFKLALEISLKLGDEHSAAEVNLQQGWGALVQGDIFSAVNLYEQALAVFEKYNDQQNVEKTKRIILKLKN